jgi:hypothetical protein
MRPIIRPLSAAEKSALAPYIPPSDLAVAVLHLGHVPWYLPRRFDGIARGRHIYFRRGVYQEGTVQGIALLGHELVHVGQYREGMTALGYLHAALRGYRRSRYERAACAVQARILGDMELRLAIQPNSTMTR